MEKRFKDTYLLQEQADYFRKHGVYTKAIVDTKEYYDYWDEQKRRCLEGYTSSNGISITGYHYFYLNFFRIDRAVETVVKGRVVKRRQFDFPRFYDGDYDYFWVLDICRNGITKENYEKLNLSVDIHPDDLSGGKNLIVLKARRKGYSYKNAAILTANYYFIERSNSVAYAYDKKYLEGDGIYQKFLDGISFIDANTPYIQPKLIDRPAQMAIKSGYKVNINGTDTDKGMRSLVQGISLKDNPDGVRGGAKEIALFEELGKFPGVKKAYDILHHTVQEGTDSLGLIVGFGTGGTENADFEGAEKLFFEPETNGCIRINNKWDEGADGTWCGFFSPIYTNLSGFIDEDGNSLVDEATEYENKKRELKRKSKDPDSYSQYVAEMPFNPREATLAVDMNLFPTQDILSQYNNVIVNRKYNFGAAGVLYETEKGIKFKLDPNKKPVYKFPHGKEDDLEGAVIIYEAPVKHEGKVPTGLYLACHDPYAHDSSTNRASLGATYIIKRTNNFSSTYNECIVASYIGRPRSQDEYNRIMFMLAEYYNAKIGFENDRGDVKGYATRFKKLYMLEEQFTFLDKKELQGKTKRAYGMNMTKERKAQGEIYIRDWLLSPISNLENGEKKLILHSIVDPALLQELIKYNKEDGNFDRVMALIIGMYHRQEVFNKQVKAIREQKHKEFFNRFYKTG